LTRLAVYTDHQYRREDGRLYSERAFTLFLVRLATHVDRLVILGKVNPDPGRSYYELPSELGFVELPYYASLTRPRSALQAMSRAIAIYWRELGEVDGVWLLGPHPLAIVFACLAAVRRKSVALGVRQDFRSYVRARHPDRRWVHAAGNILEASWRILARYVPVVAVGQAQAAAYPFGRTLEIAVSLVDESDIVPATTAGHTYEDAELRMLSVGRLEEEKNPLLLADILALAREQDDRWRLIVCGEGPLEQDLRARLAQFGLTEHAELLGYVANDGALREIYRHSHALLHVSWTEGLPQVLFEAFAARLPVVATAVGGVAAAAQDAALLIEPGDARAAADALARMASDAELRSALTEAGVERVSAHTLDAEARGVAAFISSGGGSSAKSSEVRGSLTPEFDARIEAEYSDYRASDRKLRAWANDNPGNRAAREELLLVLKEIAGPQLDGSGPLLDLGCGTGGWVNDLSRLTAPERVHGADLLESRLVEARRAVPGAHFVRADARQLPFENDMFALVLLFTVLLNIPPGTDTDLVIAESVRVLAPGGVLVIYEPRLPNPFNRRTRTVRRRDIRLPVHSRSLTVMPPLARRLGRATPYVHPYLTRIGLLHSHRVYWYRKPGGPTDG
jgi:glycosyltransferase involved in cell wall biosynthesis/SAM-dependent methyltransferase